MEQKQTRLSTMSVPEFGGWDQKAPGTTDYSMVFTQARANKKQQKTNLTEIKADSVHDNHGQAHHHHRVPGHAHAHAHEDPVVMGKRRILTYINCCIRP